MSATEKEAGGSLAISQTAAKYEAAGRELVEKPKNEVATATQSKAPSGKPRKVRENSLLEESKQRSKDVIAGARSLLVVSVLGMACVVAFSSRLFAVIRFESIIHEFDPW